MDDTLYREMLMDYWENPKNYGVMKNPDIDVTRLNPLCGDKIRIMAKVKSGKIKEVSFTCKSCVVAKAMATQLTIVANNMKIKEFKNMKPEKFLATVETGFSPIRVKCALLAFSALQSAIGSKPKRSPKP